MHCLAMHSRPGMESRTKGTHGREKNSQSIWSADRRTLKRLQHYTVCSFTGESPATWRYSDCPFALCCLHVHCCRHTAACAVVLPTELATPHTSCVCLSRGISHSADGVQGKLVISPDVLKALREGTAVVALESTIISHGMPYPQVETLLIQVRTPGDPDRSLRHCLW